MCETDEENVDTSDEEPAENDTFVFVWDWRAAILKKEKEMQQSGEFEKIQPPEPSLSFID